MSQFSKCPAQPHKCRVLGAYNKEIMSRCGYSEEEIARFQEKWAAKKP